MVNLLIVFFRLDCVIRIPDRRTCGVAMQQGQGLEEFTPTTNDNA
jgi:hypothetical protein